MCLVRTTPREKCVYVYDDTCAEDCYLGAILAARTPGLKDFVGYKIQQSPDSLAGLRCVWKLM